MKTLITEDIATKGDDMKTITTVKAPHAALGKIISKFKESAVDPAFFGYQGEHLPLAPGEVYAGMIITPWQYHSYHLILLPGQVEGKNWADAKIWAESIGGELPNRVESALLFTKLKGQFDAAWYWIGEEYTSNSEYAWSQSFSYGRQADDYKLSKLRARAVRRLVIGE